MWQNCLWWPGILAFLNNVKIQYRSLLRFEQLYMLLYVSVNMARLAVLANIPINYINSITYSAASSSSLLNSSLLSGPMKVATW